MQTLGCKIGLRMSCTRGIHSILCCNYKLKLNFKNFTFLKETHRIEGRVWKVLQIIKEFFKSEKNETINNNKKVSLNLLNSWIRSISVPKSASLEAEAEQEDWHCHVPCSASLFVGSQVTGQLNRLYFLKHFDSLQVIIHIYHFIILQTNAMSTPHKAITSSNQKKLLAVWFFLNTTWDT